MAKWIRLTIVAMLLIPFGINEKEMKENIMDEKDAGKEMQFHASNPFYSFISNLAYKFIIRAKNYPPVALMKGKYESMIEKPITFNASLIYDVNYALQYRWDFMI